MHTNSTEIQLNKTSCQSNSHHHVSLHTSGSRSLEINEVIGDLLHSRRVPLIPAWYWFPGSAVFLQAAAVLNLKQRKTIKNYVHCCRRTAREEKEKKCSCEDMLNTHPSGPITVWGKKSYEAILNHSLIYYTTSTLRVTAHLNSFKLHPLPHNTLQGSLRMRKNRKANTYRQQTPFIITARHAYVIEGGDKSPQTTVDDDSASLEFLYRIYEERRRMAILGTLQLCLAWRWVVDKGALNT